MIEIALLNIYFDLNKQNNSISLLNILLTCTIMFVNNNYYYSFIIMLFLSTNININDILTNNLERKILFYSYLIYLLCI